MIKKIMERLYSIRSCYCNVFVTEKTMKRIVKLQTKYNEELKRILIDDIDSLREYNWTCSSDIDENGKILLQKTIKYTLPYDKCKIIDRIKLAEIRPEVEYEPTVYDVENREEAYKISQMVLKDAKMG